MMPKLSNCKHCGSSNVRLMRELYDKEPYGYGWHVECIDCGIQTATYVEDIDGVVNYDVGLSHKAIDDAVECAVCSWNAIPSATNGKPVDEPSKPVCDGSSAKRACDIDLSGLIPSELTALGKRISDTLTERASKLLDAITNELNKTDELNKKE